MYRRIIVSKSDSMMRTIEKMASSHSHYGSPSLQTGNIGIIIITNVIISRLLLARSTVFNHRLCAIDVERVVEIETNTRSFCEP